MTVPKKNNGLLFLLGFLMAADSLWGLLAIMMFGFDSFNEISLAVCFLAPLPVYLLVLYSVPLAAVGAWLLFFATWITRCFISKPPTLISPIMAWFPDVVPCVAIALTYIWIAGNKNKKDSSC
ncbi:hypothetical protein [Terriglobus sp. ADX1]|uniref:hypothetical protein n=1 Tax=Terriglobus sp. ADX1 TaxID=2794063 RepID=UPI002FE5F886